MADLDLAWKGALHLTPGGDLALVEGEEETQQHIIRRLFSATTAYIWHKSYGLGLIQRIGNVATPTNIAALVRSGLKLEATVATTPVPVVTVSESTTNLGLFFIAIQYTSAVTGQAVALQFEVPSP